MKRKVKKKIKRTLAIILTLSICVSTINIPVYANENILDNEFIEEIIEINAKEDKAEIIQKK